MTRHRLLVAALPLALPACLVCKGELVLRTTNATGQPLTVVRVHETSEEHPCSSLRWAQRDEQALDTWRAMSDDGRHACADVTTLAPGETLESRQTVLDDEPAWRVDLLTPDGTLVRREATDFRMRRVSRVRQVGRLTVRERDVQPSAPTTPTHGSVIP